MSAADLPSPVALPSVALVGNPNCGKTALFNLLTGARQKVANYAGVTVERKEGKRVVVLMHQPMNVPFGSPSQYDAYEDLLERWE